MEEIKKETEKNGAKRLKEDMGLEGIDGEGR